MTQRNQHTVVVTGGSRGIGRAICLALAAPDTPIYFNYFSPVDPDAEKAAADETERLVAAAQGTAIGRSVNVAVEKEVADFFEEVLDATGRIDVLVNNAGITKDGLLVRLSENDWDVVLDINLKGAFRCTKIAAKAMMKQRYGRIINISSVVGVTGNPGQANYSASKAGLIGLTKTTAKELASRGITVNAVAPGFIETDMTASLPEKARNAMLDQVPLGRAGKPEDVAGVVAFLASEGAAYITGQVIHVSGGMYM
ncbi:MAG: 3-oxoacyl-[acyl-carrier-protein] reductase [Pseudomonadota bacterium]|uniref:3-oxoacyl-[acyl-carrier-protein] reductase n=1 Tax=Candidatus Desulfatibia profunda TaxID=2841695 RepID=A0A8J6NN16_9BACT|nr:3-oxoacyl-[acyl-carrier-protein] reductase [Candidatus Desulfatibia profunda]MBL7179694.1 3-oxoacyl-[acyl-carrier-protein] reductase [Desulfobacterales bacterium]